VTDGPLAILFVCSGNICRSPYAEVAARSALDPDRFTVSSAGTVAIAGDHATDLMHQVASERGLDLRSHRATPLRDAPVPEYVFGMEQEHLVAARRAFPDLPPDRIRLLAHPSGVPDPYGRDLATYRTTATMIDDAIATLSSVLPSGTESDH
jgi:protein-tyrosine-phosphatase